VIMQRVTGRFFRLERLSAKSIKTELDDMYAEFRQFPRTGRARRSATRKLKRPRKLFRPVLRKPAAFIEKVSSQGFKS
jgi:hypothetical protein